MKKDAFFLAFLHYDARLINLNFIIIIIIAIYYYCYYLEYLAALIVEIHYFEANVMIVHYIAAIFILKIFVRFFDFKLSFLNLNLKN